MKNWVVIGAILSGAITGQAATSSCGVIDGKGITGDAAKQVHSSFQPSVDVSYGGFITMQCGTYKGKLAECSYKWPQGEVSSCLVDASIESLD